MKTLSQYKRRRNIDMAYSVTSRVAVNPNLATGEAGTGQLVLGTVNITSYTANGETLTARDFGLSAITHIMLIPTSSTSATIVHFVSNKVRAFRESAGTIAEVAGATDLGTFSFIAFGTHPEWD